MGRKGDNFWQHAVKLNGRFKCNYCKDIIPGGATRIKSHLSGIRGNGVKPCPLVPDNVRAAALVEVVDSSNRRAKTIVGSSNFEGCSNSASAQGMQNLDEITTNYDSLDENMKVLKQKLEKLTRREADIKSKVEELESLPGKKRKIEVETWLRDVKQGKRHVFGIETDIKKLTQEVTKLVERELPESLIQDDVDQTREDDLSWATNLLRFSRALENFAKNESKFLKKSFLYCAFYLENEELDIDSLITRLRDEGLIDGTKSLEGQFEEGLNILHQLENGGLLEVVSNNRVVMHELYRVTAKSYTKGRFVVKANMGLTRIPHEIKSSVHVENMEKVSLFNNKIDEISLSTSPKFLKLTTLILCRNPLGEITDYFFLHMPAIQVLDLSYTNIKILPDTVSDLRSLTTLCLSHCSSLRYVPCLAKLQDLMRLDLSSSIIPELPQGLEMLLNLRWLNLLGLFYLDKLTPMLVVSKLTKLQYLALPWNTNKVKVKADDLKELKMLETFTGNFHDSQSLQCLRENYAGSKSWTQKLHHGVES
ncbi:Disease resistance protein [Quillaja saponaria]|uniref:Disease resistance protein n=1 Tax=Quillaja saponaria TaxID=32244 RepID=A0AAD7KZ01_QUISA|nr:Disease resistance protein [Quillaja saponaria]